MNSPKNLVQKIFIIASGVAFLGMMTVPMLTVFQGGPEPVANSDRPNQPPTGAERERIVAIADGYAKVLEREPENPTALQGLVETRLQLGDLPGAIPPLEKLVALYPEQKPLKELLTAIKQQVGQAPQTSPSP